MRFFLHDNDSILKFYDCKTQEDIHYTITKLIGCCEPKSAAVDVNNLGFIFRDLLEREFEKFIWSYSSWNADILADRLRQGIEFKTSLNLYQKPLFIYLKKGLESGDVANFHNYVFICSV